MYDPFLLWPRPACPLTAVVVTVHDACPLDSLGRSRPSVRPSVRVRVRPREQRPLEFFVSKKIMVIVMSAEKFARFRPPNCLSIKNLNCADNTAHEWQFSPKLSFCYFNVYLANVEKCVKYNTPISEHDLK